MLPLAIRITTALSLGVAAVGEGVCKGDSCREAPVDLLQNQVKVHNQKALPNNACVYVGMGDYRDETDRSYGCAKDMYSVWYHDNADARDSAAAEAQMEEGGTLSGSEYYSQDKCFNEAASHANCGGNVLYHQDGIRCYCVKDADAWCKKKHMPSFVVAECTCTLHPGTTCAQANVMSQPRLEKSASAHDCLAACIAAGNSTGCCQWNDENENCKLYLGGASDDWHSDFVVTAGNENKHVMLLDECFST